MIAKTVSGKNKEDIEKITYLIENGFNINKLCYKDKGMLGNKDDGKLRLEIELSQKDLTQKIVITSFSKTLTKFINQFVKKPKFWKIGFWNAQIKVAGMEFIDIIDPTFTWKIILAIVTTEFVFKIDINHSSENKEFSNVNLGEKLMLLIYNTIIYQGNIVQIKKDVSNPDILEVFCK